MNVLHAIAARRSIRKFQDRPISQADLQTILTAATQAPSGKNRQPWRFLVLQGQKQREMLAVMRAGLEAAVADGQDIGSSLATARALEGAAATIFIYNPYGKAPWLDHSPLETFLDLVNTQSIGAAIQNMTLAALELGIGSLWICDVFEVYQELHAWLGEQGRMVAALALGYPDEHPGPRPRKALEEVVRWL